MHIISPSFLLISNRTKPPFLIVHDRNSTNLRIPVLASHLRKPKARKRSRKNDNEDYEFEENEREEEPGGNDGDRIEIAKILECFFDWTGKVERCKFVFFFFLPSQSYILLC